jgi:GT2 family glycosyltransferase
MVLDGTALMRRDVFELVGGYDDGLPAAWEVDLHCRMAAHGAVVSIEEPLIRYRLHPGSNVATSFFEGRSVHRFVETRERAILREEIPPTYQSFLEDEDAQPLWTRLNIERSDRGQFYYRTGGVRLSEGRRVAALFSILRALVISPGFVLGRVWARRLSPAASSRLRGSNDGR